MGEFDRLKLPSKPTRRMAFLGEKAVVGCETSWKCSDTCKHTRSLMLDTIFQPEKKLHKDTSQALCSWLVNACLQSSKPEMRAHFSTNIFLDLRPCWQKVWLEYNKDSVFGLSSDSKIPHLSKYCLIETKVKWVSTEVKEGQNSSSCHGQLAHSSGVKLDPKGRMLECHWLGQKQVYCVTGLGVREAFLWLFFFFFLYLPHGS